LAWHEEIVVAYERRLDRQGRGYEVLAFNIDEEYLRYIDRVLEEMAADDRRLPHPRNPDRTHVRSAAAEVILPTFIRGREAEGDPLHPLDDPDSAMAGDLYNVLLGGLIRRMDPSRLPRLAPVVLLLPPAAILNLDEELTRIAEHLMDEDRECYLGDCYHDFRSSFIEAALVTWMILHELVAEEAVPDRNSFAQFGPQQQASRRGPLRLLG
jgi:hypothetical protein